MGFIDDLRKGLPGLLVAVPEAWQVREDQARRAVLTDNEHKVGWHITHAPFYVDTNPAHEAQLRREVERHVRWTFAEQYGQLPLPQEALASRPPARTADPKWSPLISLSRVDLSGQP